MVRRCIGSSASCWYFVDTRHQTATKKISAGLRRTSLQTLSCPSLQRLEKQPQLHADELRGAGMQARRVHLARRSTICLCKLLLCFLCRLQQPMHSFQQRGVSDVSFLAILFDDCLFAAELQRKAHSA